MPVKVKRRFPRSSEDKRRVLARARSNALTAIGVTMEAKVKQRFADQPSEWKALKSATIKKKKGSDAILIDLGYLVNAIRFEVDGNSVKVGVWDMPVPGVGLVERALIALVHEEGSPKMNIPQRSFLRPVMIAEEQNAVNTMIASFKAALRGLS